MRRCLPLLLLAVVSMLSPGIARAEGLEISDIRTDNYPRIIVRFSASTVDGTPISSLKADQIHIWENGAAQPLSDFYSLRETGPDLWVALAVDVSGSMNDDNKLVQAKEAAKAFVSRLRPRDRTTVITFNDKVAVQLQPTGDPAVLRRAIDGLQASGSTRMNDGLARAVSEILRAPQGARRAVILLSDGEDTDSQATLEAALGPALDARLPVYTIGLGGDAKGEILSSIASQTKARYYAAPRATDLDQAFKLLSGQLSSQYEAWWDSKTTAPSGVTVSGRLQLDVPGGSPVESAFSYVVPVTLKPPTPPEHLVPGQLRAVERPSAGLELPPWGPALAALLAAAGVYLAFHGATLRLTRSRLHERLGVFVSTVLGERARVTHSKQTQRESLRPVVLRLARLSHRLMPTRLLDDLRHRLVLAGRPSGWHFSQFLATKLILAAMMIGAAYLLAAASQVELPIFLLLCAALAGLGWYLPHVWLGGQIRARQKAIQRALPDALDLMTVGVGAGLSLDGAVLEIVQKSNNQLSQELANFLAEMRMGRSRREALQGLDARTGVEDIKVLVASLIQADELGMSLSETLVVQADQMRMRRRQRAEELAHKATVKMMIPMVTLIFPALFIVIIGPAVPGMIGFLSRGGGG